MRNPIFDLDGTLINSSVLDQYYKVVFALPSRSKERTKAMNEVLKHVKDCNLYSGIEDVFQYIRDNNLRASIATNATKTRLAKTAKVFDIPIQEDSWVHRFSFDQFGSYKKPHPRPILTAIEMMNSQPSNSIMIGNSTEDIISANRAKVSSVACHWGVESEDDWNEILQLNPTYTIYHPSELIPIIAS